MFCLEVGGRLRDKTMNAIKIAILVFVFSPFLAFADTITFQPPDTSMSNRTGARICNDGAASCSLKVILFTLSEETVVNDIRLPVGKTSATNQAMYADIYANPVDGSTQGTLVRTSETVTLPTSLADSQPTFFDDLQNLQTFTFLSTTTLPAGDYSVVLKTANNNVYQNIALWATLPGNPTTGGVRVYQYDLPSDTDYTDGADGVTYTSMIINHTPPVEPPPTVSTTTQAMLTVIASSSQTFVEQSMYFVAMVMFTLTFAIVFGTMILFIDRKKYDY